MTAHEPEGVSVQGTPVRGAGRPEYKPTQDQRDQVRALRLTTPPTQVGVIAATIGVSRNTLRKHFAEELAAAAPPAAQQLDLTGAHSQQQPAPATEPPREAGRPEFDPTWRQREDVKLAKGDNWPDDRIARFLGISRTTLLKHFAEELEWGVDMLRMGVLRDLKASSAKGNRAAAATLLNLPGMIAGPTELPQPDDLGESAPAAEVEDPSIGKKERARRDAQTAHVGTSWNQLVN